MTRFRFSNVKFKFKICISISQSNILQSKYLKHVKLQMQLVFIKMLNKFMLLFRFHQQKSFWAKVTTVLCQLPGWTYRLQRCINRRKSCSTPWTWVGTSRGNPPWRISSWRVTSSSIRVPTWSTNF